MKAVHVPVQLTGKFFSLPVEQVFQRREFREAFRQVIQRGVGRVAVIPLFIAPVVSGCVFAFQQPADGFEFGAQRIGAEGRFFTRVGNRDLSDMADPKERPRRTGRRGRRNS
jgi:ABC-type transporter Mla maintaining outer membrane lipid asymmetry permease subunit MlaE